MSIFIDKDTCNGCGKRKESMCERICPGDLLFRDTNGKAIIRDQGACWTCAACVKACPVHAIELMLPLQIGGNNASLKALVKRDKTIWQLKDSRGMTEEFAIKSWVNRGKKTCPAVHHAQL